MGSDRAPAPEVAGAVRAARARDTLRITLVGDAPRLDALLGPEMERAGTSSELRDRIDIVHATEVVTMHDHPGQAFRQKPDSSMRVAVDRVEDGQGDAVISAGHTGAKLATSRIIIRRPTSIERSGVDNRVREPTRPA